jgi:hypothetical protein
MRRFLWVAFLGGCTTVAALFARGQLRTDNDLFNFFIVLYFIAGVVGAYWMAYMGIRHEEKPLFYILFVFVPFAFVSYYFERVRPGKVRTDIPPTDSQPKISFPLFLLAVIAWLVALWFQLGIQDPRFIPAFALFMLPVVIHAVGLVWMIYTAIRYEEQPLPFLFLSCVPFTFVWYYFARIRAGKARRLSLSIAIRP